MITRLRLLLSRLCCGFCFLDDDDFEFRHVLLVRCFSSIALSVHCVIDDFVFHQCAFYSAIHAILVSLLFTHNHVLVYLLSRFYYIFKVESLCFIIF